MTNVAASSRESTKSRYKRYPTYKDSGVEWLGEVPTTWDVRKVRRIFRVVNGSTPSSGDLSFWDGEISWVTPEDLGGVSTIAGTKRKITELGYRACGTNLVPPGSLVLSTRAPIGHVAVTQMHLCTNQGCRSLVFRNPGSSKFFYYELFAARGYLEGLGRGSTFKELSTGDLNDVEIAMPPEDEQRRIAGFLDRETARLDTLVEKKEKLIELLQERRASLIAHVVTKGLDPTVPMKDSGIEWLGEIPAHWPVKPLKALSTLQTGVTLGKHYEGEILTRRPYLRVANVQDGYLDLEDVVDIEIPERDVSRYELRRGDVLVTEGGDFDKLGRGYVWEGQLSSCLHQNHIFAIRPIDALLDARFLVYLMSSGYGRAYFTATSKQSTNLASTNSTKLRNIVLPAPVAVEQHAIAAYLDAETARIDKLIARVREAIERLKELRIALISAAVTGKIDVRGEIADATSVPM